MKKFLWGMVAGAILTILLIKYVIVFLILTGLIATIWTLTKRKRSGN